MIVVLIKQFPNSYKQRPQSQSSIVLGQRPQSQFQSLIIFIDQVSDETRHVVKSWSFSLPLLVYSYLPFYSYFCKLFASIYIRFIVIPFLYSLSSCVDIYMCYCSDYDLLQLIFIACSGYFQAQRVYIRYLPRVYTSPTLVAISFSRILGSET